MNVHKIKGDVILQGIEIEEAASEIGMILTNVREDVSSVVRKAIRKEIVLKTEETVTRGIAREHLLLNMIGEGMIVVIGINAKDAVIAVIVEINLILVRTLVHMAVE